MGFLSLLLWPQTTRRRRRRQSSFQRFLHQSLLIFKVSLIFILLLLIFFYVLPSLKFFCLHLAPHFWRLSCEFFSRHYLFGLLNLLILIIVLTTHLHQKASGSGGERSDVAAGQKVKSQDEDLHSTVMTNMIHPANDSVKYMDDQMGESSEVVDPASKSKVFQDFSPSTRDFRRKIDEIPATGVNDMRDEAANELCAKGTGDDFGFHDSISEERTKIFSPSIVSFGSRTSDRPLCSSRFANRIKSSKENSDQLKPLRISRPVKKGDTLEATWKAITEGRHAHLYRHHRKSETWDVTESTRSRLASQSTAPPTLHKVETFDTAPKANASNESSARDPSRTHHPRLRRREPSINQEELNRKVESFIAQFNEQIRLQRQESLLNYMQMVDRGVS